jgi:hypothetical protein
MTEVGVSQVCRERKMGVTGGDEKARWPDRGLRAGVATVGNSVGLGKAVQSTRRFWR